MTPPPGDPAPRPDFKPYQGWYTEAAVDAEWTRLAAERDALTARVRHLEQENEKLEDWVKTYQSYYNDAKRAEAALIAFIQAVRDLLAAIPSKPQDDRA